MRIHARRKTTAAIKRLPDQGFVRITLCNFQISRPLLLSSAEREGVTMSFFATLHKKAILRTTVLVAGKNGYDLLGRGFDMPRISKAEDAEKQAAAYSTRFRPTTTSSFARRLDLDAIAQPSFITIMNRTTEMLLGHMK